MTDPTSNSVPAPTSAAAPVVDSHHDAVAEDRSPRFVTRTVWYKRVEYPEMDGTPFSLEQAIRSALAVAPHWKNRQQLLRESPREVLVFNEYQIVPAGVTGRLALYEKDAAIEIGTLDENAPTITTELLLPSGANRQMCSGTLHFLVRGNHVVLVPSRSVRWQMLANFFNEWLGQQLRVMPESFRIGLLDVIPDRARAELSKVRRVEIRTALTADVIDWENEEPGIQLGFLGVLANTATQMAKQGAAGLAGRISVRDAVAVKPLHARMILEIKGKHVEDDGGLMEQIALAIRGQEDVPFVIRYGKRGRLTNRDISISDQLVLSARYGHPQFRATARRMLEWFEEQLTSGNIPVAEE